MIENRTENIAVQVYQKKITSEAKYLGKRRSN
jgi:hypothetical protein